MPRKTYVVALNEALAAAMRADPDVVLMGEDIAGGMGSSGSSDAWGGAFAVTRGLVGEFGRDRVVDTPISEAGYLGLAAGASMNGVRVVAEIMFADFFGVCWDQLLNNISKFRYMYDGQVSIPITIRTAYGAGIGGAGQHSQCLYSMCAAIPGLKVVVPSCAFDAKGLLAASIRDDNPVVFFEHKLLYGQRQDVPDENYVLPIGKANIVQSGEQAVIVAVGRTVEMATKAAKALARDGIACTVIDPRTIAPLDLETVLDCLKVCGQLVIVDEDSPRMGFARDLGGRIASDGFDLLKAPIRYVTPPETPVPFATNLEAAYLPDARKIESAVRLTLGRA